MKRIIGALAMTVAAVGLTATGASAETYSADIPYFRIEGEPVPDCNYEDGSGQDVCAWVASERGNGRGQTYIVVDGSTYIYLERY